jgi:KUP system potassium uptake protein
VDHNNTVHESVVILSVQTLTVPHVPPGERVSIDDLGYGDDGITHVAARFGFQDDIDVPATLRLAADRLERCKNLETASYFLSRINIVATDAPGMAMWRKKLFVVIARNAASPVPYFCLPDDRTVVLGSNIDL